MDDPCADCGKKIQVQWSGLWDVFLCVFCRNNRTSQELTATKVKAMKLSHTAALR